MVPAPTPDELFARFWAAYPRREAKKDARKAWGQVHPDAETVQAIFLALAWQTKLYDWIKDDGRYVPLPASYLRGERWTDEPPPSVKSSTRTATLKEYWWDECQRIHGGACQKSLTHFTKMRTERTA